MVDKYSLIFWYVCLVINSFVSFHLFFFIAASSSNLFKPLFRQNSGGSTGSNHALITNSNSASTGIARPNREREEAQAGAGASTGSSSLYTTGGARRPNTSGQGYLWVLLYVSLYNCNILIL